MSSASRVGALDIAGEISRRIASYVDMNFMQFVAVEDDVIRCWYMNSGGEGPSFEITLRRQGQAWNLDLIEHPPGTEQPHEIP